MALHAENNSVNQKMIENTSDQQEEEEEEEEEGEE
jgi:hypothetical protein